MRRPEQGRRFFLSPESPGGSIAASPPTAMQELAAIKLFRRHIEDCETLPRPA